MGWAGWTCRVNSSLTDTLKVRGQMQKKYCAYSYYMYIYIYHTHMLAVKLQSLYAIAARSQELYFQYYLGTNIYYVY